MPSFILRVELHEPHYSDYNLLHDVMKKSDFARAVKLKSGGWGDLPPGEYSIKGDLSTQAVYNKAKYAARSVVKHPDRRKATTHYLLVTKSKVLG
jgi:hypothetical protein